MQAGLADKPAVCSPCSHAARSQVWKQREMIEPACPGHLSWHIAQGWEPLSPPLNLSTSLQVCPDTHLLGQHSHPSYLHAPSLGRSYGNSRTELRPSRLITRAAVVTGWAKTAQQPCASAGPRAGLPPTTGVRSSNQTAPITALLINRSDGPMKTAGLQLCSR